ncbi:transporter protein smf2 [Microsporum canis CBS 113480]|uniref:Transporter protein smf2 n=1 Tax=Arthroderma otae (strain ATCC MYA-4605 / CBS 113480) TaxID=554155 RepID=C5FMY4_ARTOC|nr:transporter protein smf2 [Microsporum canis CBS 113480]EEQ31220.1 transporter protein smf2 [Microsporum canis CBS 113480]
MNKTSRTDEPFEGEGYNQNPNPLSNDLITNEGLNGIVNSRELKREEPQSLHGITQQADRDKTSSIAPEMRRGDAFNLLAKRWIGQLSRGGDKSPLSDTATITPGDGSTGSCDQGNGPQSLIERFKNGLLKFCSFIGPGFMVSVAYSMESFHSQIRYFSELTLSLLSVDPGNYATGIAAGASYRFRLLFVILMANLFAILLQSLAVKLGTVSGLNLAEACRAFLPRWLNILLYVLAEVAIIATDIAEVIGFAIGLNLLIPKVPLVAGCAISIFDVMIILFFYRPDGSMKALRAFEAVIICLVFGVVICFCIQLSLIKNASVGQVFRGYLPSGELVESQAIYQACGILGATVMPHSLYLGSGIVQPRLREYDAKSKLLPRELMSASSSITEGVDKDKLHYIPSIRAIRHSLKVSITELTVSLFSFALFVNSAILIIAGASLYQNKDALEADIFGIHALLSKSISPAVGTIFALALLLSGISAGVVCTIAGQMVSEGALNWKIRPWLRRLVTRSISIIPSIIIAGAVGRQGLNATLNASQVVLSVVLPFVAAPLIYFTCLSKYMTVQPGAIIAVLVWLFITVMNIANLVLLGQGA